MTSTGILLIIIGLFVVINSGSFRDIVAGKASFGFLNPKQSASNTQSSSGSSSRNGPGRV